MILPSVLIVEDEEDIRDVVVYNLQKSGYTCYATESAEAAQKIVKFKRPDLILLDIMLPGMDGFDFCKWIKNTETTSLTPVIIISARGEEDDIVKGLELGADDYIQKPISPKVLQARLESVWRRIKQLSPIVSNKIVYHGLSIDLIKHHVEYQGVPVELTLSEFGVLELIMRRPGWVYTRRQIMEHIKGESLSATERSVDVVVVGLRKKIGDAGSYISTVRGIGYRFTESD